MTDQVTYAASLFQPLVTAGAVAVGALGVAAATIMVVGACTWLNKWYHQR